MWKQLVAGPVFEYRELANGVVKVPGTRISTGGEHCNERTKVSSNEHFRHEDLKLTWFYHEGSETIWRRLWLQPVLPKPETDNGRWETGVLQELHRLRLILPITCSAPPETHTQSDTIRHFLVRFGCWNKPTCVYVILSSWPENAHMHVLEFLIITLISVCISPLKNSSIHL